MFHLSQYLEDIEERLNEAEEDRLWADWLSWTKRENAVGPFEPAPRERKPSRLRWPHANINDALEDDDLAIYREFEGVNANLSTGSSYMHRVRVNTGVGNVSSAFGAPRFVMAREADTLPNVRPIGENALRDWLERPLPPIDAGNFAAIFRISERFQEIARRYPKIGAYVRVEQPDMQGPMDNLELLWGSDMFYALYDSPEIVHALLSRVTDFIERFMDAWKPMFPDRQGTCNYFRHVEKGGIAIRDDSAMNLSPAFYTEFIAPYDGRLLRKYGGIVHFCGRGDHYIGELVKLQGLYGVNMSQPHLNHMETILACTVDRGIHLSVPTVALGAHDARRVVFMD